jgi:hypothetical protein
MTLIVTGDDVAVVVALTKNNKPFVIDPGAVVKAAIVSTDHARTLADPSTLSSSSNGSDWAQSTIVVTFSSVQTQAITEYKPALLEIEVNDNGKQTWFLEVKIVKGQIS